MFSFVPQSYRCFMQNLAFTGQAVQRRRSLHVMVINTTPGREQTNPWGTSVFRIIHIQYICPFSFEIFPSNDLLKFFTFKCMGDLSFYHT